MKIDLIGMIFHLAGADEFDKLVIDDDGRHLNAHESLHALIMEYAKVANGGESTLVVVRAAGGKG